MAKETVETKVVQVRFDNSKFSKNINATIKQCEKFDKSLQFKGSKKEISAVQKAINGVEVKELNKELEKTDSIIGKISVSFKELVKIKLLSKAMDVVINKSAAMMKSMVGIGNVLAGWQQYEAQMTNVGGILNQVESKGYGLEDVSAAMERLRWYTDETSYSFTTLSNGIRQFVIAGIDLNKAAEAAMGVTNLAGSAKVFDEYKIQSAMDAVSKAMQTGYMDTLKWTSLTNTAGIVTEEFSQKLLDEAVAQGKLIKSAAGQYKTKKGGKLVTAENIRSTLSDKWLTADVLANVMDEYASASTAVETFSGLMEEQTDEALAEINKMFKDSGKQFESWDDIMQQMPEDVEDATELTAEETGRFLKDLGYQFDEVSYKAFKSAQETTSFSQSLTYVKKAISTQWANIFEKIFGDYEKSTELWSDISGKFYRIFVMPFEKMTDIFDEWSQKSEGGAEDLRNVIRTIIDIIGKFKEAVSSGFREVFGELDSGVLVKITKALTRFFNNLKNNEALFKAITAITKIFASSLKIIGKVSSTLTKIWIKLFQALEPILEVLVDILDLVADGLIWIINMAEELGIIDGIVKAISIALTALTNGIRNAINWIKGRIDLEKIINNIAKAINWLRQGIEWLIEKIKEATEAIKEWWQESEFAQGVTNAFAKALQGVKSVFTGVKPAAEEAAEGVDELTESGEKASKKFTWIDAIKNAFKNLGDFFKNIFNTLKQFVENTGFLDTLKTFGKGLKDALYPIWEAIASFFKGIFATVKEDPIGALKKLLTAFGIVIAILLMLRVGQLIYSASWVLDEFARLVKAFRKNILALRWKALMKSLLYVAASVLIITYAIERISKINAVDALKGVAAIIYILLAYMAIIKVLTTSEEGKTTSILAGIKTAFAMLGLAAGLSIFISAFAKLLEKIQGYSTTDIIKAGAIFYLIGVLLIGVIAVTFRKLNKEGIFKGEKLKGPGLLAFAKTLLFIWGFLKITLWFAEEINKFDSGELTKAGIVLGVIVTVMIGIMVAVSKLITSKQTISVHKFTIDFSSILLVLLAAMAILKVAGGMSLPEIGHGALAILVIFSAVAAISVAMGFAARIAMKENVELKSIKLNGAILSITSSVLFATLAFKMISSLNLSLGNIWKVGSFILVLYVVLGLIAIGLSKFSKVVDRSIGKEGVKFTSTKSPVASVIFAMTASILIAVLAFKLLNSLDPSEFYEGFNRFAQIMLFLVICVAIMQMTAKELKDSKGALALLIALEFVVITMIVIGALLNSIDEETIQNGVSMFVGVALFIAVFVGVLAKIVKTFEFGLKQAGAIVLLMVVFVGLVAGFIFAAKMLDDYLNEEDEDFSIIGSAAILAVLAGAVAIVLTGFVFAISKAAKKMEGKMKSIYALMGIMSIMVVLIAAIIALIFVIKDIPLGQIWKSYGAIAACGGLIIAMMALFVLIIKMKQKLNIENKNIWLMAILIGVMTAAIGAIVGSLVGINALGVNNAWKALAVCGVILGGVIIALGFVALISKLMKNVKTSSLVIISVIMAVFAAVIIGIAFAMQMIYDMANDPKKFEQAATTVAIIGGALFIIISILLILASILAKGEQVWLTLLGITAMMIGISVALLAIAGAIYIVSNVDEARLEDSLGTIVLLLTICGAIIAVIGFFAQSGGAGAILAGAVTLIAMGAALLAFALSLQMIAKIDEDKIDKAVETLITLIIALVAAMIILAALGSAGVGWIGVAMLAAIGVAAVLLAASLLILSIAVENITNSIIKLMNETTPEKCKNIASLGASLMSLAAGTITNALADFGASLLGLGGAFIDFQAAVIGFKTSALKALGDIVEGIGSFFKGIGENKEAKAMERKVQAYKDFADAMDRIAKIDQNAIKQIINSVLDLFDTDINESKIKAITECLEELIDYFTILSWFWREAGGSFNEMTAFLTKTIQAVSSTQNIGEDNYLTQLMNYLEELKTSVEEIGNPVITPVLDLTSFREGMAEIRQSFGQSGGFVANYSAVASANNVRNNNNYNPYAGPTNPSVNTPVTLVNNFALEDHQFYGVQACRDIFSTLDYAVNSTFSGIGDFFARKFGW